jgi:hypothetical protein
MSDHDRDRLKLVLDEQLSVKKPDEFDLGAFKSTRDPNIPNVVTLPTALPHYSIADAGDFVRLHSDEAMYWSDELCFVNVPIKGQNHDTLHLITEKLAERYLPSKRILRFRLALATKPYDVFFLCEVPSRNLDNSWNETNIQGCQISKTRWAQVTSRKPEGIESYLISYTESSIKGEGEPFPEPTWPKQSLNELILVTFANCKILTEDHPALARIIGAKQSLK